MKYIRLFESFSSDYEEDIRGTREKYENEIKNYLHELTDEFPIKQIGHHDLAAGFQFKYMIRFPYSEFKRLRETLHQGIFDRIIDDYPGTEIKFRLAISKNPNGSFAQSFGRDFRNVDEVLDFISPEKIKIGDAIPFQKDLKPFYVIIIYFTIS